MQILPMLLQSDAVNSDGFFDPRYTCDSDNSSPELRWYNVPEGVREFALIAWDLDLPLNKSSLWVVCRIPAEIHHLPAGIPPQESLPNGIHQGVNGWGKLGYSGPCPPAGGRIHHYLFQLFALDASPEFKRRLTQEELLKAIRTCVIGTADLAGKYHRYAQRAG